MIKLSKDGITRTVTCKMSNIYDLVIHESEKDPIASFKVNRYGNRRDVAYIDCEMTAKTLRRYIEYKYNGLLENKNIEFIGHYGRSKKDQRAVFAAVTFRILKDRE